MDNFGPIYSRFRHAESAQCLFCVDHEEIADYLLMHYSRFPEESEQLKTLSGTPFSPSGLFAVMLANREAWELGHRIIINMMKRVRSDEMVNRVWWQTKNTTSAFPACRKSRLKGGRRSPHGLQ